MGRKVTIKILEALAFGTLTHEAVAEACLKYMSEDEVADMAHDNGFFEHEEEEKEDGGNYDDGHVNGWGDDPQWDD